jgi:tripartite ATP-independent transporter DctM subunit
MAMGPILGTGGLAIIIPPSALAVLLGSLARIDIGQLLIGGVLPGLVLATFYAITIYVLVRLDPDAAPAYEVAAMSLVTRIRVIVVNLVPMGFVIFMVIGLILIGVATPSEAAAFGVLGVLVVSAGFRKLTWAAIVKSLQGTMKVTGMVFLIIMASSTFSQILAMSGATAGMIDWATSLDVSATVMLAVMFVILLILGCLMEQVSIMMLTVPIFFPLAQSLGFDLIWFGVIVMLSLEIGLITPPFGLGLFVLIGVAPKGTTLFEAAAAGVPYILCAIAVVACIVAFPPIALYLPSLMH